MPMNLSKISSYFEYENKKALTKDEISRSRKRFFSKIKDEFVTTDDGTLSLKFEDTMHSKIGALKESLNVYSIPSRISNRERLLDICSGFGYNTLYAVHLNPNLKADMIEKFWEISATSLFLILPKNYSFLEKDFQRVKGAIENRLGEMGIIKNIFHEKDENINLYIGEAEHLLLDIKERYDAVFFDPYKDTVSPELYTVEFAKLMSEKLKEGGMISSYVSSYGLRSALSNFLNIGRVDLPLKKVEGTSASFSKEELSIGTYEERVIALTDLGVPYRKFKTRSMILSKRSEERNLMRNRYLLSSSKRDIVNFEDAFNGKNEPLRKKLERFGLNKELVTYITCPQRKKCVCEKCEESYDTSSKRIKEMRRRIYRIKGANY